MSKLNKLIASIVAVCIIVSLTSCSSTSQNVETSPSYAISYYLRDGVHYNAFIIDPNKTLYVMSKDNYGRKSTEINEQPYKVLENVKTVKNNYALKEDGTLWILEQRRLPRKIAENISDFIAWSIGLTAFLKNDNSLWGPRGVAVKQAKLLTDVKSFDNFFAIKKDDTLWRVGYFNNESRKIFDGVKSYKFVQGIPTDYLYQYSISAPRPDAITKSVFVIKNDNSLWEIVNFESWQGTTKNALSLETSKKLLEGVDSFKECNFSYYAITLDHSLWAWGNNDDGQLGDKTQRNIKSPVKMLNDVSKIQVTGNAVFATKMDSSVWTWGKDLSGNVNTTPHKLIDNAKENYIVGNPDAYSGAYTPNNVFFLKNNNQLWQLDNVSTSGASSLIMEKVKSFSYTSESRNAIMDDGSLWSWGTQFNPDGSVIKEPKKFSENASQIINSEYMTFFTKSDGSLWVLGHFPKLIKATNELEKVDFTPWKVELK